MSAGGVREAGGPTGELAGGKAVGLAMPRWMWVETGAAGGRGLE